MKNESILILGDSYSTFKGFIPEGYEPYYPEPNDSKVLSVEETWWHRLASETESNIVLNNSWSGSTICNTGYNGDCSQTNSFIFRLEQLISGGFFEGNRIDRVFVLGGTNDSWTQNACGEIMYEGWKADDLFLILPGVSYFLKQLLSVIEKNKIHFILNCDLREEVTEGITEICVHYGVGFTQLKNIEKAMNHPTPLGMEQIKQQVLADIK